MRKFIFILPAAFIFSTGLYGDFSQEEISEDAEVLRPDIVGLRQSAFDVFPHYTLKRPKVGLVLSGGGARGIAHLGVIEVLEESGIPIDFIAGASMGSLIGGLYSVGYSTESMRALVDTTDWDDILSLTEGADRRDLFMDHKMTSRRGLFTIRFDGIVPVIPASITPAQRLSSFINHLILQGLYHPVENYDDLRVPFRAVATDIVSGERIIFDSGDLVYALRASISVPLLFAPVKMDDMLLVDGGLVSNIPVDIARMQGCDLVIAVNTTSGMRNADQISAPWEIVDQMITIMQQKWNRDQLRLADVVITPPINDYLGSDFDKMDYFIEEGRITTEAAIDGIRERINEYYALKYSNGDKEYAVRSFNLESHGSDGMLRDIIGSELKTLLQSDSIRRSDLIRLLNAIHESGWFHDVYTELRPAGNGYDITLHAKPNIALTGVAFTGNQNIPADTLATFFSELIELPANNVKLRRGLEQVLSTYRGEGYSLARISTTDFNEENGLLTVGLDEGVIGDIRYSGNRKTRTYVMRREFPLHQGDVFRVDKAMQGIRNISGTRLFNQVIINTIRDDDAPILVINVDERHSELVRLSMRIDEVNHFQPMVELRNENLFGHGMEMGIGLGGGLRNRLYQADFTVHRIFDTYLSSQVSAFYRFDDIDVYRDNPEARPARRERITDGLYRQIKWGGNITIGSQLERIGNVSGTIRVEKHSIDERTDMPLPEFAYYLTALRLSSLIDTFDRYPFPREGIGLHAYYESAFSFLGSEVSYTKFFISYESYSTYFRRHTFRPRFMFGFGDETLPLSEQFSLGGQKMLYGLHEYDGRGRQIFILNLEYRFGMPFKILFDTYLHVRYDVGSIWAAPQDIHIDDLIHGIGIGIGFDTAVLGPVEIAAGKAYRFDTGRTGPVLIYFSIGYPLP